MRLFARKDAAPAAQDADRLQRAAASERTASGAGADVGIDAVGNADRDSAHVDGERSIASVNRTRSLHSRINNLLGAGLMIAVGGGLLVFYYTHLLERPAAAKQRSQSKAQQQAQSEMALPPLGPIAPPAAQSNVTADGEPLYPHSVFERVLGPAPEPPPSSMSLQHSPEQSSAGDAPAARPVDRRLGGAVFTVVRDSGGMSGNAEGAQGMSTGLPAQLAHVPDAAASVSSGAGAEFSEHLHATPTAAARAQVLPTRRLLLPKGAFLDCTLETAIDSTLPGMTTCILATDVFSADGTVVLLERGSKLVGETRGQVAQGAARVFVIWTEARTAAGIVVPLASPGTDELGRAGLAGIVDRHFWDRFGAAILLSVIDGAVQAATQSSDGDTVVVTPSAPSIMTEVLKGTVNIPPTVRKHQGDRIQVLVARDLDFRSVYELRVATGR